MSKSVNERSDNIVGVGGCDDDDRSGRMDDDDDQWKKTKQRRHGFGRNLKKAKRKLHFRLLRRGSTLTDRGKWTLILIPSIRTRKHLRKLCQQCKWTQMDRPTLEVNAKTILPSR
ncbi:hypothetical protein LOK49_LG10G02355 [Camellia lanceoleosa]|uniref:Uncharacterized protein n=1 Tax=Camellia lanceoleosa TaxID=1840588 RepID=A0ACC0GB05_9ERIC|nr:hypothetical protein LOK49_LG10G02355 [Camellia lanceoleosa]